MFLIWRCVFKMTPDYMGMIYIGIAIGAAMVLIGLFFRHNNEPLDYRGLILILAGMLVMSVSIFAGAVITESKPYISYNAANEIILHTRNIDVKNTESIVVVNNTFINMFVYPSRYDEYKIKINPGDTIELYIVYTNGEEEKI